MDIRKPTQGKKEASKYKNSATVLKVKKINTTKKVKRKINYFIVIILFSILCTILFLRSNYFYINNITVDGARKDYNETIKKDIEEIISSNYFYLIPKKNILIYPQESIKKDIYSKYTNINNISFTRKGLHELNIRINERIPVFYVTENEKITGVFIDINGYIFKDNLFELNNIISSSTPISERSVAYSSTSTSVLPVDFNNSLGTYLNSEEFSNLQILISDFKNQGVNIFSVLILNNNDIELRITENGGVIRVNTKDNPKKVLDNFSAIKKDKSFQEKFELNRNNLIYIDMRFGNKAFYKFN